MIIFPGALGDLLLALPALRALRARHAGARLTVVLADSLRDLVARTGIADETVALESADVAELLGSGRIPAWLATRPELYSWLGADDAELRRDLAAPAAHAFFFKIERGPGSVHAAVAYARAVRVAAGPRTLAAAGRIVPVPSAAADETLARLSGPVLVIHPGAGARAKRWDIAGFIQVAHWWRVAGGTVLAIAGPAEAGEPPALGAPEARDWPLVDLAAVLSRAALYLGNDSGVTHLAGAVGTPGAVLFGPTDPRRWRPLFPGLVALRAHVGGPDGIPLTALPAARVIAACRRRFALTRGEPEISVPAYHLRGRT